MPIIAIDRVLLPGLLALNLGLSAAPPALGQTTVYRCGPGANQYSSQPCSDGRVVDVDDPRDARQVAQARENVAEQRRMAAELARERREAERARPALAGAIGPLRGAAAPASAAKPGQAKMRDSRRSRTVKAGDGNTFVAIVPGSGKANKKKKKAATTGQA